jgi:hypothetical protein
MNLELGKIYRETGVREIASYVIILDIIFFSKDHEDMICELIRVYRPENVYREYLDILEGKLVEVNNFI